MSQGTEDHAITAEMTNHLRERIRGDIVGPGSDEYDEARSVWNATVDKYPAIVVRPTDSEDVIECVRLAADQEIPLAVKGSGHMTTGHAVCDDGLVVDLSSMVDIRVDETEQTVCVQAGATWADVNQETIPFGLVPPGTARSVGVAGFTLGGGQGYLTRTHGLASDLLQEVEVVTADGDLVTASETEHPDLFWAIRGGGGNFGIVTSFTFQCFEIGTEFMRADLLYRWDAASGLLELFRDTMTTAPDELFPILTLLEVPAQPAYPEALHGEPAVAVTLVYVGDPEHAEDAFEPFLTFSDPVVSAMERRPYTEIEDDDEFPSGVRRHWESVFLNDLPDDLIDTLVSEVPPFPTPRTMVSLFWFGGAVSRYPPDSTAFAHRDASFLLQVATAWDDPGADHENASWTRNLHRTVSAFGTGGEYINTQTDDDFDRIKGAYGDHYERLREIKATWDPENRFRINQNVEPAD